MALIENSKIYSGNDLAAIFFTPLANDKSIQDQGIRVLYNMPVPTTIHLWGAADNVLKPYKAGWQGSAAPLRSTKTLEFSKVKAESAFDAADYYSQVYQHIISRPDVNLQDLSGTDLEQAETEIFKAAIAEDLRVTTWIGNTSLSNAHNTFDGILYKVKKAFDESEERDIEYYPDEISSYTVFNALLQVWNAAPDRLKALKRDGQLVFYVSSDFYRAYEEWIYQQETENGSAAGSTETYTTLYYRGIPLEDIGISAQQLQKNGLGVAQCLLTDRRNLVLALNTADYPDAEVRMWYNPDQMENRQRAVFLAAADFIDFDLIALGRS